MIEGERDPFSVKHVGQTFKDIRDRFSACRGELKGLPAGADNNLPVWVFHGADNDTIRFYAGYSQA